MPGRLLFNVASQRPAKLQAVAQALKEIFPGRTVIIQPPQEKALDPGRIGKVPALRKELYPDGAIIVQACPLELQARHPDVKAMPEGEEETTEYAILRLDTMKEEYDCSNADVLVAVESGLLDGRIDAAIIALEGRAGRPAIFRSEGTLIPIFVDAGGTARDAIAEAKARRDKNAEAGDSIRQILQITQDRGGTSWQQYLHPFTPRDRQIAEAIIKNWHHVLPLMQRAIDVSQERTADTELSF